MIQSIVVIECAKIEDIGIITNMTNIVHIKGITIVDCSMYWLAFYSCLKCLFKQSVNIKNSNVILIVGHALNATVTNSSFSQNKGYSKMELLVF